MALTATTIKETRFRTFIAACVLKGEKLSYDKNLDQKREKKEKSHRLRRMKIMDVYNNIASCNQKQQ